jgi:hypothetical protein
MLFYIGAIAQGKREVVKVEADSHIDAVRKVEGWAKDSAIPSFRLTGSVLTLVPSIHKENPNEQIRGTDKKAG